MSEEDRQFIHLVEEQLERNVSRQLQLVRSARRHERLGRAIGWTAVAILVTTIALVGAAVGRGVAFVSQLAFCLSVGAWLWQRHWVRDIGTQVERLRLAYDDQHQLARQLLDDLEDELPADDGGSVAPARPGDRLTATDRPSLDTWDGPVRHAGLLWPQIAISTDRRHRPVEHVLDLLADLVAVDTTSRRSNLPLLDLVEDRVADLADATFRVPDETGTKANLAVRFGPDAPGGVVLSGHTDCVPVDGQDWTSEPFTMTRHDDRVVGRGTVDMKGFIACCLAAAPDLAAADLSAPVWFALSHDEELGALGARTLAPALAEAGAAPEAVIVGEPTSLEPVTAHKSVRAFTFTFAGHGGHSSQPSAGANAVVAAARVATYVADLAADLVGDVDPEFDPPHTTFNVGMIEGGTAINIIPDHGAVTFEYRALPSEDGPELADRIEAHAREVVLPELQRTWPDASLTVTSPGVLPAFQREVDGAAEALARQLTGTTAPTRTAPFGTDASRFQQLGWSTVVCGPGRIDVAHRPDEWIALDQLDGCSRMLDALVARLGR